MSETPKDKEDKEEITNVEKHVNLIIGTAAYGSKEEAKEMLNFLLLDARDFGREEMRKEIEALKLVTEIANNDKEPV